LTPQENIFRLLSTTCGEGGWGEVFGCSGRMDSIHAWTGLHGEGRLAVRRPSSCGPRRPDRPQGRSRRRLRKITGSPWTNRVAWFT